MKRVLLITSIFPPDIGGPSTFIDALGHALSEKGYPVTVICVSKKADDETDALRPFRVIRVPVGSRVRFEMKLRPALALELLRHELVLVNGLYEQTYQFAGRLGRGYVAKIVGDYAWETARNMGLTNLSIDEFQTCDTADPVLKRIRLARDRYLAGAVKVITPSEYLRRMVVGWGVPGEKVVTVLNGVSAEKFKKYEIARRGSEPFNVAFCGRLTNWKGVETLLLAARDLKDVRFCIIGNGPSMPMLTGLASQLGIADRVRFPGRMGQDELRQTLSGMHALALPSLYEGLSHTLLEAFAIGLPCIASNRGGNPEVIEHGKNGFLIPYGGVPELIKAVENLRDDEELRRNMAVAARQSSERFSFENTVRKTIDVLCG